LSLKNILKLLKLNESTISMVMGVVVVLVIGGLMINYFRNVDNDIELTGLSGVEEGGYEVVEGDSLWSIAESEYGDGFEWVRIAEANDISNGEIEVGQKLVLPEIESEGNQQTGEEVQKETPENYTVKAGDSLWDISVSVYGDGYRWVEIARANNLSNPDIIHSGNVLVLP
jgi:putative chitinase